MNTLLNKLNPRWLLATAGALLIIAAVCLMAGYLPTFALALLGFELLLIVGLVLWTTPGAASSAQSVAAQSPATSLANMPHVEAETQSTPAEDDHA